MPIIGRKVAAKNQVMLVGSGGGNPRLAATVYGPATENSWVTAFGGWVGTRGTAGQHLTIGAFTVNADGTPGVWLGEAAFTVNAELSASAAGGLVQLRQTVAGTGLSNQGIPLAAGEMVALYCFSTEAVAVSWTADAARSARSRTDVSAVPAAFGSHAVTAGRALDLFLETAPNNDVPVVSYSYLRDDLANGNHRLSPFFNPSGAFAVWGGEPALTFGRYDLVDAAHGDELSAVQMQVGPKADAAGVSYDRVLTKGELFSVLLPTRFGTEPIYELEATYTGPKLAPGTYFCRARFADYFGAWSEWTSWLSGTGEDPWAVWIDRNNFFLEMTPGLAPIGKVAAANPASFAAVYAATSNVTATKAHLLIAEVGNIIDRVVLSRVVAVAVAPGGTLLVAWDPTWPALVPGTAYAFRLRAIHERRGGEAAAINGVFDADATGWTAQGIAASVTASQARTTTSPRTGAGAYQHTITANTQASTTLDLVSTRLADRAAVAGDRVTVDGWVRPEHANLRGYLALQWLNGASAVISTVYAIAPAATLNQYSAVTVSAVAPAGTAWVRVLLVTRQTAGSTTGVVRFDDIALGDTRFYVSNAPDWQYFTLNALPDVPSLLAADNASGIAGRPLLTAVAGDADDTPATGFGVRFRITRPDTSTVTVNAALVPGTTTEWAYQTDAAALPGLGSYSFQAQSFNGADESAWSSAQAFTYAVAPVIAITAPSAGATVSGATLTATWTSDSPQTARRVVVTDTDADLVVFDSELEASASLTMNISTDNFWHGHAHSLAVMSVDDLGLTGVAAPVAFTVLFALPATPANFSATPAAMSGETEETVVALSWDPVVDPNFAYYQVSRQATTPGDDGLAELDLRLITDPSAEGFIDRFPASEVDYTYRVRTVIEKGLGTVASAPATDTATVQLSAILLEGATFGVTDRVWLRFAESSGATHIDDMETLLPWGQARPVVLMGSVNYRTFSGTYDLLNESAGGDEAREALNILRTLSRARAVICFRDDRGRKMFGVMRLQEDDRPVYWYVVTLSITETAFAESVGAA